VSFDQFSYDVDEHAEVAKAVLILSGPAYFDIPVHIFSARADASG